MPNHCHNRVTFYSANTEAVAKLKQIFEDESCFTQIIPEPDWANTPLMSSANAVSGITLLGAILVAGQLGGITATILGLFAVILSTINVVGGFMVTDRMLGMFRKDRRKQE